MIIFIVIMLVGSYPITEKLYLVTYLTVDNKLMDKTNFYDGKRENRFSFFLTLCHYLRLCQINFFE